MKYVVCFLLSFSAFAKETNNQTRGGGRFQLIQLSEMRRDQFLLDTQTGKIWQRVCLVGQDECALEAWMAKNVEGITVTSAELNSLAQKLQESIDANKTKPPATPKTN